MAYRLPKPPRNQEWAEARSVDAPGFQQSGIQVAAKPPFVSQRGQPILAKWGKYQVTDDAGRTIVVRLISYPWSNRPGLRVGKQVLLKPETMPLPEAVLATMPIGILVLAGLSGLLFGLLGLAASVSVARSSMPRPIRLLSMSLVAMLTIAVGVFASLLVTDALSAW